MRLLIHVFFILLLTASAAFAQLGGGTISGTVVDEQG